MYFKTVAQAFETIDQTSSRTAITKTLAQLLHEATPQEAHYLCYLSLGELHPPHIGTQFNLAQKSMLKIVAGFTGKTESFIQNHMEQAGDLGTVLQSYAPERKATLTVDQLYHELVAVEHIKGNGSQEAKAQAVSALLAHLDPLSAKFAVRIIMGKLRLGFYDMTLLDALSWMEAGDKSLSDQLEEAYNLCADIGFIAQTFKSKGIKGIAAMKMQVGTPVRPAAAERLPDVKAIMDKLGKSMVQPKLDGFRLQVHIDKTKKVPVVHFFSRNLADMSLMFPDLVAACEHIKIKTMIADGEAMVYDPNTGHFVPFQETVKRRRKHGIEEMVADFPLQLHFFDILFLDEKSLIDLPQIERYKLLAGAVDESKTSVLKVVPEKVVSTPHQLEEYFLECLDAGLEGVVVKKMDAPYAAGKRNSNWIKLKYEASKKLDDTMDLVILGYYPGRGKRAQFGIGAFLVGTYNAHTGMYETIAKVGTGLTDEQWVELRKRCDKLRSVHQPKNVVCDKALAPAVWTTPEQVCEVLADEVTVSPLHSAGKTAHHLGWALRFPRFVRYRDDKSPEQATTLAEIQSMHKKVSVK